MSRFEVDEALLEERPSIQVNDIFESQIANAATTSPAPRTKSPGQSKNYLEFVGLVEKAIRAQETAQNVPSSRAVKFSWDRLDDDIESEVITASLTRREPGKFAQGAPFEGSVKHLRPILREVIDDEDNPGYRIAVLGRWFDNLVRFTCWAQTNQEAMERAFWLEKLMEDYKWFFIQSGVQRVYFWSQEEVTIDNDGNKLYGRSLTYYVKTEEITTLSEKTIETVSIELGVGI